MGIGNKYEDNAADARGVAAYGWNGADLKRLLTDTAGHLLTVSADGAAPVVYDYIALSYTGSNLTGIVYKTGGSGGTTVATLTLGYDGSDNLISITRS